MKRQNYRNPYQYNYLCSTTPSTTFNYLFRNLHQIQSPTLDTGEATALLKKFQKISFEDKCTFLFPFHSLFDNFDMNSHDFDFDTLRNKAKRKLIQKFGALVLYRRKSFCYRYYRKRLKKIIFLLATPVSIILFFETNNRPLRTNTL